MSPAWYPGMSLESTSDLVTAGRSYCTISRAEEVRRSGCTGLTSSELNAVFSSSPLATISFSGTM